MKKSRKLLCVLLAAVMIFSMLSVMAFAADEDVAAEETVPASAEEISPETAGIIGDAFAKLPNYLVVVKTPWGTLATGAQVVLYNQNKDEIVATAAATRSSPRRIVSTLTACPLPGRRRPPACSISPPRSSPLASCRILMS